MKKVISYLITVIILFLTTASVYFLVSSYADKEALPNIFGYCPMIVISGSMEPELDVNQLIIMQKVSPEECKINDIIVYRRNEALIIHRLINKQGNYFITKGDANIDIDAPFAKEYTVGKYVGKIPLLGSLVAFLKTNHGSKCLFITQIILITIVGYGIYKRGKKRHEKDIYRNG